MDYIYVLFCAVGQLYYLCAIKFELLNLQRGGMTMRTHRLPPCFFVAGLYFNPEGDVET